jgi:hypothetical protein
VPALTLILLAAMAAAPTAPPTAPPPAVQIEPLFLYGLSSPTGLVHSTWAALSYDRKNDEVFVVREGVVDIYNRMGMVVHTFAGDGELGAVSSVAVVENGDIFAVSTVKDRKVILHCDYRGDILEEIEIKGLPSDFGRSFQPDQVAYHAGNLYFAESVGMRVVVTDLSGTVQKVHDLQAALGLGDGKGGSTWMRGFSVDGEGRMLVTMPIMFSVGIVSPDGTARRFGTRGSAPGRFNIVGKMVADEKGNLFITDTLRSVVMVFDPDRKFLGEFGYRGEQPSNLISPVDIAVGNGKVFVAQAGNRGVSVFRVKVAGPPPPPTSAPATPPPTAAPR